MKNFPKSILAATVVACLIGGSIGAARAADAVQVPAGFTITGSGFGHGVGMSQYGAQGMGLDGKSASEILTHYYNGTTVDAVVLPSTNIRVGILQDKTFVAVRGEFVPGTTSGGGFNVVVDSQPAIPIAPGVVATFRTVNGRTEVSSNGTVLGIGTTITLNWVNAVTVLHIKSGVSATSAVAALGDQVCAADACSNRYRYGTIQITSGAYDDSVVDLAVVNTLRLSDEYLYGLGEVPSSWTEAAMQAQAIAGRSYALRKTQNRTGCNCQIYATTLDQSFVGYSKEIATSGNRWVAAVNATIVNPSTAYVVRYNGSIISTYYSSSTGGKSQPTSEVWGSSFPYLVSVDDPWSNDTRVNNSNSTWVKTIDQTTLVSRLRALGVDVADVWSMTVGGNYASGGISKLDITDSAGNLVTLRVAPGQKVTPDGLRTLLGTKSTYISAITPGIATVPGSPSATAKKLISVTKVNWPSTTVEPKNLNFSGKVSPAQLGATVKLQKKVGGKWKTVSTATTNRKGSWSILWTGTTAGKHDLRITATNSKGTIKTSTKRVTMAGSMTLSAPKSATRNSDVVISGGVSPGFSNVQIVVERKVGYGSWKRIATVTTDAAGKWTTTQKATSKKSKVSYRVKTTDARLGVLISKTKTTNVK